MNVVVCDEPQMYPERESLIENAYFPFHFLGAFVRHFLRENFKENGKSAGKLTEKFPVEEGIRPELNLLPKGSLRQRLSASILKYKNLLVESQN